jgi:hypothetical protein
VFTGVASFGERISDVMDDGGGVGRDGTDGDIVSWINRNAGRMGGPDGDIVSWINRNAGRMGGPDVEIT